MFSSSSLAPAGAETQQPTARCGIGAGAALATLATREHQLASERTSAALDRLAKALAPQRRLVHAGDLVVQAGERFDRLFVVNAGLFKIVNLCADGREQVVGLKLRGDWLGFDGIAAGRYGCDAVALDTGEVWALRYEQLLAACARDPALMGELHGAMSREITRERDALMAVCTLPADARVADFLQQWAESLARCGLRNDQISLRMTRAEIGNCLGLTLETVSRALSRLARCQLIEFAGNGRRDIRLAQPDALAAFVQRSTLPARGFLQ